MFLDIFWHIVYATVADFNCIVVESFVKFEASWKIFCYQLKEYLCNVCSDESVKGGLSHIMFCFRIFMFSNLLLGYFKSTS